MHQVKLSDLLKLQVNRVVNLAGQVGRHFGNSLLVLGLIYYRSESGLVSLTDTDDLLNIVVVGLNIGSSYWAFGGIRLTTIAGGNDGVMAAAAVARKHAVKRFVPM